MLSSQKCNVTNHGFARIIMSMPYIDFLFFKLPLHTLTEFHKCVRKSNLASWQFIGGVEGDKNGVDRGVSFSWS